MPQGNKTSTGTTSYALTYRRSADTSVPRLGEGGEISGYARSVAPVKQVGLCLYSHLSSLTLLLSPVLSHSFPFASHQSTPSFRLLSAPQTRFRTQNCSTYRGQYRPRSGENKAPPRLKPLKNSGFTLNFFADKAVKANEDWMMSTYRELFEKEKEKEKSSKSNSLSPSNHNNNNKESGDHVLSLPSNHSGFSRSINVHANVFDHSRAYISTARASYTRPPNRSSRWDQSIPASVSLTSRVDSGFTHAPTNSIGSSRHNGKTVFHDLNLPSLTERKWTKRRFEKESDRERESESESTTKDELRCLQDEDDCDLYETTNQAFVKKMIRETDRSVPILDLNVFAK